MSERETATVKWSGLKITYMNDWSEARIQKADKMDLWSQRKQQITEHLVVKTKCELNVGEWWTVVNMGQKQQPTDEEMTKM